MSKCYIIAGGEFDGFFDQIKDDDLVIAADKGYEYVKKEGLEADFIVGDFDSTSLPESENVIKLSPIKDDTDTKSAMKIALEKGYKEIIIYGGLGGRESHTISNIRNALEFKKMGIDVRLKSKDKELIIIGDELSQKFDNDYYVSIFALSEVAKGLTIKGLYYELDNYDMEISDSLGVSNETCGRDFTIKIKDGYILIIFEKK